MSSYELLFLKFPQMWLHPSWFEGSLRIKQIKIENCLERGKLLIGVYNGSKFMNYLNLKNSQDIVIDIYLKNKKYMPLTCLSKQKLFTVPHTRPLSFPFIFRKLNIFSNDLLIKMVNAFTVWIYSPFDE